MGLIHNTLNRSPKWIQKNKATDAASQTFIESIQEVLNRGLYATGLFFDLSKAYDVITHDTLLDKLNSCAIRNDPNLWFKSYSPNRLQSVEIKETDCSNSFKNSYTLSYMKVKHSAPQGSLLEKILFLLYINDLTENVHGQS
jgi:hypothetical protein